jgi:hypothetical protein
MLQKVRVLLLVGITAVLAACGGGGGDSVPSFAGNYSVTLNRTVDNCNTGLPATSSVTQYVTQTDRSISLKSGTVTLTGSVDGDNGGFSTSFTQVTDGIVVLSTTNYRTATAGSTYAAVFNIVAGPCTVTYSGTAKRI